MDEAQRLAVTVDGALSVDLWSLSLMIDLRERLARVTADQIAASNRRFDPVPKRGKIIDTVTEMSTMALHALWMSLDSESDLEEAKAGMAVHEHLETDHKERHALLAVLAAVAREMFWAQVKLDVGFHKCVGVGIYKDWTLVEERRRGGPGLLEVFGGSFPMGGPRGGDDE